MQIDGRLNSASIKSFELYSHSLVIADDVSDYRWVYMLKAKNHTFAVVKKWGSYIAYLRA